MTYSEFWPRYLRAHRNMGNVAMHATGTVVAAMLVVAGAVAGYWLLAAMAVLLGYAFAWIGHFVFERNSPTALKHPLWSFMSDFRLTFLFLTRRIGREFRRHAL
jgi:hypothetical protein